MVYCWKSGFICLIPAVELAEDPCQDDTETWTQFDRIRALSSTQGSVDEEVWGLIYLP